MTDTPVALLRAHARLAPWNARGLAAHVAGLVDAAGVRPTNASARAAPSARAVRFYVANRLMDRPEGAGTSAVYNYRHFLQLLAIKIRQREGLNLEAIRKELGGTTGDALERRVAQWLAVSLAIGAAADSALKSDSNGAAHFWRRVQVVDGVELHVRDDAVASTEAAVSAMRDAVRSALSRVDS
ncbi:MAG: MerR family transcriptional regulator [Gemmatimonadota bacterium]